MRQERSQVMTMGSRCSPLCSRDGLFFGFLSPCPDSWLLAALLPACIFFLLLFLVRPSPVPLRSLRTGFRAVPMPPSPLPLWEGAGPGCVNQLS